MKFKSALVTAASGSIGGLTASHNRGGQYLRARTIPTNPGSAAQVALRAIFGGLSIAWQTLTDLQREAWTTYAIAVPVTDPLGDSMFLTGHQMYVRCNTQRVQAGLARVDDGPVEFSLAALSPVSVLASEATQTLLIVFDNTDGWAIIDDGALLLYPSRQKAPTINFFKGPYRFAGTVLGNTALPPTSPDTTIAVPFEVTEGNKIFARVVAVEPDGRISAVQRTEGLITA